MATQAKRGLMSLVGGFNGSDGHGFGGSSVEALRRAIEGVRLDGTYTAEMRWVNPSELRVSPRVQREMRKKAADALARMWEPVFCGPLTVSEHDDGSLWVVCGNHRRHGAIAAGTTEVPALVWRGLSAEDEAWIFLAEDHRVRVTPFDRLKMRQEAGDPAANEIGRIVSKSGFALRANSYRHTADSLACITAVERAHAWGVLARVLSILRAAYNGDPEGTAGRIVVAVAILCNEYGDRLDDDRLATVLERVGTDGINAAAYQVKAATNTNGARAWAAAMVRAYNDGKRTGRLNGGAF